jgi:DNA-binding NarL/FixJ family response regulator
MLEPAPPCEAYNVPIRVLIVDDSQSFLDAAGVLLEREGLSVAGVASTTATALRQAEQLQPDVVLVDITLGGESGFDVARLLFENDRDDWPVVILISTHEEADFADLIAASPASAFLPKSDLSAQLIQQIVEAKAGAGEEGDAG